MGYGSVRDLRFAIDDLRKLVGVGGIAPPRLTVSETGPSAVRGKPHAVEKLQAILLPHFAKCGSRESQKKKLAHPAGLPPANSPFEAEDDCNFTTDAFGKTRIAD